MRAIVLAGGYGKRLRPYTLAKPKPLMELCGVPIVEIIVRQLRDAGFDRITLALFHRSHEIQSHFGNGSQIGVEIDYSVADAPLGTAGPLSLIERPQEACLVLNADVLTDIDYADLYATHTRSGALATLVASRHTVDVDFGVLDVDGDRLRRCFEKPTGEMLVNAGVYCLDPAVWDRLGDQAYVEMPSLIQSLGDEGNDVRVYPLDRGTHWIDVGVIEQYYEANREFTRDPGRYLNGHDGGAYPRLDDPTAKPAGLAAFDRVVRMSSNGGGNRVQLYDPDLGEEEVIAVSNVLRSRWISMGPETEAFESECADALGVDDAVAVSSGTAALHLAAIAMGLGPGDEVIVPSLTFVASAAAMALVGAQPVFCDVKGPHDLTLDPADVEARITPRTRAIVMVHYAGYPADIAAVSALARKHGLAVIEDAAHAPMTRTPLGSLGTLGDIGCFSFYATKNMTMGEGGLVVARDPEVRACVRSLRSHAITRDQERPHDYDVLALGLNYRPSELAAALGRVQLSKLGYMQRRRRDIARAYHHALASVDGVEVPFRERGLEGAHHLMPVLLPGGASRDDVRAMLERRGIQTSVHYPAAHLLTRYRDRAEGWNGDLPITEDVAARQLSLPMHTKLRERDIELTAEALAEALRPVLAR